MARLSITMQPYSGQELAHCGTETCKRVWVIRCCEEDTFVYNTELERLQQSTGCEACGKEFDVEIRKLLPQGPHPAQQVLTVLHGMTMWNTNVDTLPQQEA